MTERLFAPREQACLPPPHLRAPAFRNIESPSFEPLATPLNDLGLVDRKKLIHQVKATLIEPYKWPSLFDDEHHLQWPRRDYPNLPDDRVNPHVFRNLPGNKMDWPRAFHSYVHAITMQPRLPEEDVMFFTTETQFAIDSLHRSVQVAKMLTRNPDISTSSLTSRHREILGDYGEALGYLRTIPSEFHPLDLDTLHVHGIDELLAISGQLGRLATADTVAVAARIIRQPHAPHPAYAA